MFGTLVTDRVTCLKSQQTLCKCLIAHNRLGIQALGICQWRLLLKCEIESQIPKCSAKKDKKQFMKLKIALD